MKHLLFAVFENNDYTQKVLGALTKSYINGTAIGSISLKHILNAMHEEHQFITLRHIGNSTFEDNTTFYTVLDEEDLKKAQDIIREETQHFTLVKGGMFVIPLESYEGTF